MKFSWGKMGPDVVEERKRVARIHLEFCAKRKVYTAWRVQRFCAHEPSVSYGMALGVDQEVVLN